MSAAQAAIWPSRPDKRRMRSEARCGERADRSRLPPHRFPMVVRTASVWAGGPSCCGLCAIGVGTVLASYFVPRPATDRTNTFLRDLSGLPASFRVGQDRVPVEGSRRPGPRRPGPRRSGPRRSGPRAGQVRAGQVRAGQVRAGQVRAGQVRAGQVRVGQVRFRSGPRRSGPRWSGPRRSGRNRERTAFRAAVGGSGGLSRLRRTSSVPNDGDDGCSDSGVPSGRLPCGSRLRVGVRVGVRCAGTRRARRCRLGVRRRFRSRASRRQGRPWRRPRQVGSWIRRGRVVPLWW